MGPQLCSCGNLASIAVLDRAKQSFNGAATLQLRKHHNERQTDVLLKGFNGAATLQLRKPGAWRKKGRKKIALQWGRNFAVAET